jgi:hypothetical protein
MFINLFTSEAPASVAALVSGLPLSLAFGALSGAVVAILYDWLAVLAPRQ